MDLNSVGQEDCARTRAGRGERQWKNVLSWMLGVAGTRHFLRRMGIRGLRRSVPFIQVWPNASIGRPGRRISPKRPSLRIATRKAGRVCDLTMWHCGQTLYHFVFQDSFVR